ncbi:MAG: penicillin acylase family protein, partial [Planctomycetales bacterium]|nr:penicillin acylase family protein [Planctomycetales bacterium]
MKPIAVPNPARRVNIARDENGVPHVRSQTWLDALYGLGFMHALDRGAQLLFSRSVASGRGCEQIANSPELLETDRFFRRIGLHQGLDREVDLLSEQHRSELNAYCEGVNE